MILSIAFFLNEASPTAKTSSTTRISGSKWAATAKPSLTYMPVENLFTGVSKNFSISAKATISSSLFDISLKLKPFIDPFKNIFSLPVNSGWKPVPTSKRLANLPLIFIVPLDGEVIFESTFNKVDFPAPLWPITPKTPPNVTIKLINMWINSIELVPRKAFLKISTTEVIGFNEAKIL